MNERYEIRSHFFACYSHQDWNVDDPSWQDVVDRFVRDDGEAGARYVREELNKLLNEALSDVLLVQVLEDLGSYYHAGSPSEMRVWLASLHIRLQVSS